MIGAFSILHRLGRNSNSGGISLYIREDTLSYLIAIERGSVESFYVELNWGNKTYLINGSCNPYEMIISKHLATVE